MKSFTENCYDVFERCVLDYHVTDNVDAPSRNPYAEGSFEHTLYAKNHVDAVQPFVPEMLD